MKVASAVSLAMLFVTRPAAPALPGLPPAVLAAQSVTAKPKARLFPPLDLGLLEAADRDQWQRPEEIMDALKIAEGSAPAAAGLPSSWRVVSDRTVWCTPRTFSR